MQKTTFFQISNCNFLAGDPENCLPAEWLASPIPVIFDFRSNQSFDGAAAIGDLYCLFPVRIGKSALLEKIPSQYFIADAINGTSSLRLRSFIRDKNQFLRDLQSQITLLQRFQTKAAITTFRRPTTFKKRDRF